MPMIVNGAPLESDSRRTRELQPLSRRKRYLPCFTRRYGHTLPFTSILSPKKWSIHMLGYWSVPSGLKARSCMASGISNSPEGSPSAFSTGSRRR